MVHKWQYFLGPYSLKEPDSTRHTVDYSADPTTGFKAVVKRSPDTPLLPPAVVPIFSTHHIKGHGEDNVFHTLFHVIDSTAGTHTQDKYQWCSILHRQMVCI